MANQKFNYQVDCDIEGLNGVLSEQYITVRAVLFDRYNYQRVFETFCPEAENILYVLGSLDRIPSEPQPISPNEWFYTRNKKYYVGQSTAGVQRIASHCRKGDACDWWEVGVAFYSSQNPFRIETVRLLENRVTRILSENLPERCLVSKVGNTSSRGEDEYLGHILPFIEKVLRLFNLDLKENEKPSSGSPSNSPADSPNANAGGVLPKGQEDILFHNNGRDAQLKFVRTADKPRYILLKGSRVSLKIGKSLSPALRSKIEEFLKLHPDGVLTEDMEFGSPSGAAAFVAGGSVNGKKYWLDSSGVPIGAYLD